MGTHDETKVGSTGRDVERIRPFRPAWWLRGPNAQTLGARVLRRRTGLNYERERLLTPDGDFLDVDFTTGPSDALLVLLLHGLEGCSRSGYMLQAARALARCGARVASLNFRSRSGEPNRKARSYHAGQTGDVAFVIETLCRRFPGVPKAAIGFSLGGNVLLKFLGERGSEIPADLRAAATISSPLNLAATARRMETGLGRLYGKYFLRSLRRTVRDKARRFPRECDWARGIRATTLREFDEAVTAPVHGFRDAAEYYAESSAGRYVAGIRIPTLLLHSRDDPLVPWNEEHARPVHGNSWLVPALTKRGGHVGFVAGVRPRAPLFWAEREAARYVCAHLGGSPR
ncbi:MAG: YheT family hydrolase [Gemmatimonadota bacterium]